MLATAPPAFRNRLLCALPDDDLERLRPHLTAVSLEVRRPLERPNRRIDDAFFIESGIASVVALQGKDTQVEVGLIGREGMTGLPIVLGNHRTPHSTYVQVRGEAHRIGARDLREAMQASAALQSFLLKFVQVFMVQTAHTAIANARAKLDQRLARWLLMAHDRVPGNTLPLTHEFMALMLGVRRAGVTVALQALESRGLIDAGRGAVTVLDRKGIEASAGACYGVPEADYKRLMR
jgi:CRP-like cAMP-binding protein